MAEEERSELRKRGWDEKSKIDGSLSRASMYIDDIDNDLSPSAKVSTTTIACRQNMSEKKKKLETMRKCFNKKRKSYRATLSDGWVGERMSIDS